MSAAVPVLERYRSMVGGLADARVDTGELRTLSEADLLEVNQLHTAGARVWGSAGAAIAVSWRIGRVRSWVGRVWPGVPATGRWRIC
ncbi:MAG TPA: hypothetical protein VHX87_13360 [Galbitalea sp.]|nr:hypothetical protein [Galbitalea sp.]